MWRTWRRLAVGLAALSLPGALIAGCSSTSTGTPTPTGTGASSATAGPPSSAKPSSTRPKTIDLKGVDPCQILTPQQRQQLGFQGGGNPSNASDVYQHAKTCEYYDHGEDLSGDFMLVTTKGIEGFSDGTYNAETQPIQVNGFPALIAKIPGMAISCAVVVDVADGQFLDVQFVSPGGDGSKQGLMCQKAQQMAQAAVGSLAAR
ncbi:DUF3558 domain-containing protein [Gandjariella thermophila]|uniref:DUF3558 domain-containing protein n=1 Tax=Gandjariella thermophila TaxID=1931992 RepID=A0A4D4J9B5_9PSEU|nr:DUF3558 domain-containing protein [Gandjariella thermophila]GDY32144.1 hypothetical protein GTS_37770 [Gandjariella thermophila]